MDFSQDDSDDIASSIGIAQLAKLDENQAIWKKY